MIAAICAKPGRGDDGVVAEDPAEVVFVGKDVFLQRQKDAGRVDQIDQRQTILKAIRWPAAPSWQVVGKNAPAFTVASLAMIMCRRPAMVPTPQITPAAGAAPLGVHLPAGPQADFKKPRVRVDQLAIRSRAVSRPFSCCRWMALRPPPSAISASCSRMRATSSARSWVSPTVVGGMDGAFSFGGDGQEMAGRAASGPLAEHHSRRSLTAKRDRLGHAPRFANATAASDGMLLRITIALERAVREWPLDRALVLSE